MRELIVGALLLGAGAAFRDSLPVTRNPTGSSHESRVTSHVADSLPSPAGPGSGEPSFAVAPDGRVFLTWLEPTPDSAYALRIASFDGKTWSAARTIRSGRDFFVNWADFPSVEALSDGKLAVHWLQKTGSTTYAYGVRVSMSTDAGLTWSAPITPHTDTSATEHGFVAFWPEGTTLGAAWLDGRKYDKTLPNPTNEMMVASTTFSAAGARGAETFLDQRVCDCCQVSAAMTANGPIVAYRDRVGEGESEIRDISVVRRVNGKWTEPVTPHPDRWLINACPVNGPAITAQGRNVALAWFSAPKDTARVKVAFSTDAGATFAAPIRLDDGLPGGRVDVVMLRDGSALVSWIERVGEDVAAVAAVRAKRVTRDGKVSAPHTIATSSAARASGFPRMAATNEHVFFAWTLPGRPSQIRIARVAQSDLR